MRKIGRTGRVLAFCRAKEEGTGAEPRAFGCVWKLDSVRERGVRKVSIFASRVCHGQGAGWSLYACAGCPRQRKTSLARFVQKSMHGSPGDVFRGAALNRPSTPQFIKQASQPHKPRFINLLLAAKQTQKTKPKPQPSNPKPQKTSLLQKKRNNSLITTSLQQPAVSS